MTTLSPEFIKARTDFADWYDNKSEDEQEFIDAISDRTSFIIDEDEYEAFIEELDSHNIEDASTFEDAFYSELEYTNKEAEFTEEFIDSCGYLDVSDMPDWIKNHVDYQSVWDCELMHDFYVIEFKGNSYFFNRNY